MKIGKEEIMGMMMAVEMWTRRDHKAEMNQWISWMEYIAKRVSAVPGVTATVQGEPRELSNKSPGLNIRWDGAKLGITGAELTKILFTTEPRITVGGGGGRPRGGGGSTETGISITAYMMQPGDEKVAAERLYTLLSNPPKMPPQAAPKPPVADLSGQWDVHIEYVGASSDHTLHLRQQGDQIIGSHQGDYVSREIYGSIDGDSVRLASSYTEENGDNLSYEFVGTVSEGAISGSLDLGEYLTAKWSAKRHSYRRAPAPPAAQKKA
jgi:L-seryl-tRNA(Ser) seleniumtransferase